MARRPSRNQNPAFNVKVAVATIKGENTIIELAREFDAYPNQIEHLRNQLLSGATAVFDATLKVEPVLRWA